MSSTNRSNAREEHIADYYVTPINDIKLFLNEFNKQVDIDWNNINVLDCCAGGNNKNEDENGKIINIEHPMSYPTAIHELYPECNIDTYDIREDSFAKNKCDYLKAQLSYEPDVIITNPPFNMAIPIIEKALSDVKENGYVIMLLRLNFFGSKERFEFFKKSMPEWCFVHHIRICFVDKKDENGYTLFDKNGNPRKGSTDSIEYAHFVFRKGYNGHTKLLVI